MFCYHVLKKSAPTETDLALSPVLSVTLNLPGSAPPASPLAVTTQALKPWVISWKSLGDNFFWKWEGSNARVIKRSCHCQKAKHICLKLRSEKTQEPSVSHLCRTFPVLHHLQVYGDEVKFPPFGSSFIVVVIITCFL